MPAKLVRNNDLFEIPEDLTYFVYGDHYLIVNPQVGGRCLLNPREFGVLEALVRARASGQSADLHEDGETEHTLAKLLLSWVVYYNGRRPEVKIGEPPLRQVYYAITDGCNLRCPYCYASSEKCLPGELTTEESLDLVDQSAELGTTTITFTGGEPMLRKDLFQIAEHANGRGLESNIITNATMIRTPEVAARIADLFTTVTVSVDGGSAATHDQTRGEGSFDKTYRALQLLNAVGVAPNINHVVRSDNVDEIEEFATFINGVEVNSVRLMNHNDLGRGSTDDYEFGWRDHLRVQQIVWTSPVAGKLRPDGPKSPKPCSVKGNCGMGGNEIYVNSLGDIYPCKLVTGKPHHAGNVRQKPLSEIFSSPLLKDMRQSTVFGGDYHADCARCYIRSSCGGGCRAYHMSESGDLKRNSRHLCRILRHGVVTQLWQEVGFGLDVIASHDQEMTVPRLVASGEQHPVFEDWKTYTPASPSAIKAGELIPLTPV